MLRKLLYVGLAIAIYFMIWRPGRALVKDQLLDPTVSHFMMDANSELKIESNNSVSYQILFPNSDEQEGILYKVPGGLFFLLSFVGLILTGADKVYYYWLLALHLGGGVLAYLLLIIGLQGWLLSFNLIEFLVKYLVPVFSLVLVPLAMRKVGD